MDEIENDTIAFSEEARSEKTSGDRLRELAALNEDLAQIVASNIARRSDLLFELASHHSKAVRKNVIGNPNTPIQAYTKLAKYFPQELLDNPVLELLFLEDSDFSKSHYMLRNLLCVLLQQENIPDFVLNCAKKLIKDRRDEALTEVLEMHVNRAGEMTEGWHEAADNVIQQFSHYPDYSYDYGYKFIQSYDFDFLSNFWEFMPARISSLIQHKRAMAKNPRTPPKILEKLAFNEDRRIRENVARNKNTSASILDKLTENGHTGKHYYGLSYDLVVQNRNTSTNTLKKLAVFPQFKRFVAKHENTSTEILEQLSKHKSSQVRQAVSRNKNTSIKTLKRLATARDGMVCMAVMENKNTPRYLSESISRQFATHEDIKIRQIIAKNENTPIEVLERLKTDDNFKVRARVAQNKKSSVLILKLLANDKDNRVRAEVVNNKNTPNDLLEQLISDRDCWVRNSFIYNNNIPSIILEEFISSPDYNTRQLIAKNPNLPLNILEQLVLDSYSSVRKTLAKNPNLPLSILEQLAIDSNPMVRVSLAENPNLPVKIIEQLATNSFIYVRKTLAKQPNLPVKIIEQFAIDSDSDVRKNLASNHRTSINILKMLATDKDNSVCHSVVENSKCSFEIKETIFKNFAQSEKPSYCRLILFLSEYVESFILAEHSNSISWLERYAIAQNPKTPKDNLKQLAQDGNRIVRATAKESLQKSQ